MRKNRRLMTIQLALEAIDHRFSEAIFSGENAPGIVIAGCYGKLLDFLKTRKVLFIEMSPNNSLLSTGDMLGGGVFLEHSTWLMSSRRLMMTCA